MKSIQLQYQIALSLINGVGPVTAKSLIAYCGSAEAVLKAPKKELFKIPGIGPALIDAIQHHAEALRQAETEIEFMNRHGITALAFSDQQYPDRLKQRVDSPSVLYCKISDIQLLHAARIVSVVGTRQPTDYGRQICEEFIEGLAPYGVVVVSGLAYGIDVTAHRKASAEGLANFGILGHGLSMIYPSAHRHIAATMIEHGGLITEHTHLTGPDRENFPMRNRIICGMSDALLVVETAATGGSMITADLASRYGCDIFAVPGRIRDPKSAGCNMLIKSDRARLVECAEELADNMNWTPNGQSKGVQISMPLDLSEQESCIIQIIKDLPEIAIDELHHQAGIPSGELAAVILGLEFKGLIRTLPGKRYIPLC